MTGVAGGEVAGAPWIRTSALATAFPSGLNRSDSSYAGIFSQNLSDLRSSFFLAGAGPEYPMRPLTLPPASAAGARSTAARAREQRRGARIRFPPGEGAVLTARSPTHRR